MATGITSATESRTKEQPQAVVAPSGVINLLDLDGLPQDEINNAVDSTRQNLSSRLGKRGGLTELIQRQITGTTHSVVVVTNYDQESRLEATALERDIGNVVISDYRVGDHYTAGKKKAISNPVDTHRLIRQLRRGGATISPETQRHMIIRDWMPRAIADGMDNVVHKFSATMDVSVAREMQRMYELLERFGNLLTNTPLLERKYGDQDAFRRDLFRVQGFLDGLEKDIEITDAVAQALEIFNVKFHRQLSAVQRPKRVRDDYLYRRRIL